MAKPRSSYRVISPTPYSTTPNNLFDHLAPLAQTPMKSIAPTAAALYLALCKFADNQTDECFPSQERLATMLLVTRPTIRKATEALRHCGLLRTEPLVGRDPQHPGRQDVYVYHVNRSGTSWTPESDTNDHGDDDVNVVTENQRNLDSAGNDVDSSDTSTNYTHLSNYVEDKSSTPPNPQRGKRENLKSRENDSLPSPSQPAKPKTPRSPVVSPTAAPAEFDLTGGHLAYGAEQGLNERDVRKETAAFLDHFCANGKKFVDWHAAWRNWMRRANDYRPTNGNGGTGGKPMTRDTLPL